MPHFHIGWQRPKNEWLPFSFKELNTLHRLASFSSLFFLSSALPPCLVSTKCNSETYITSHCSSRSSDETVFKSGNPKRTRIESTLQTLSIHATLSRSYTSLCSLGCLGFSELHTFLPWCWVLWKNFFYSFKQTHKTRLPTNATLHTRNPCRSGGVISCSGCAPPPRNFRGHLLIPATNSVCRTYCRAHTLWQGERRDTQPFTLPSSLGDIVVCCQSVTNWGVVCSILARAACVTGGAHASRHSVLALDSVCTRVGVCLLSVSGTLR